MLQICSSIFDKFRTTPKIKIVRDRKVAAADVFKYEKTLHTYFKDYQYISNHKFDGVTECFVIPADSSDAIQAYEAVLAGMIPENKYKLPEVKADIDSEVAF